MFGGYYFGRRYFGGAPADLTPPVASVTAGGGVRVSTQTGHDIDTVQFSADHDFQNWRVEQVAGSSAAAFSGTLLVSGGSGTKNTTVTTSVTGEELVSAGDIDGNYTIKVFVQSTDGIWST